MERQIPEADWKQWRRLSAVALERCCDKVLKEAAQFERREGSAHSRYLELYDHLRRADKTVAAVFNNPRRSTAVIQIATAVREGIVLPGELACLSRETRESIEFIIQDR